MGDYWVDTEGLSYDQELRDMYLNLIQKIAQKLDERAVMEKVGDVSREACDRWEGPLLSAVFV